MNSKRDIFIRLRQVHNLYSSLSPNLLNCRRIERVGSNCGQSDVVKLPWNRVFLAGVHVHVRRAVLVCCRRSEGKIAPQSKTKRNVRR